MNNKKSGFTLLEILLVVGIIAILAGIVIIAINPNKQLATTRNTQRVSDLKQINNAMVQYYIDHNTYPATLPMALTEICDTGTLPGPQTDVTCGTLIDLSLLVPTYVVAIPTDPQGSIASLLPIAYAATGTGTGYEIMADPNRKIILNAPKAELDAVVVLGADTPTHSITYYGNGSTGGVSPVAPVDYEEGATAVVLGKGSLVKTGYTFLGWNTVANGSGIDYASSSVITMGAVGVSLYAQWADISSPTVTVFTLPPAATSLTVSVSSFVATDTLSVTGYKLTESATPPLPGDSGWTITAPTTYVFATTGVKTLYAWAKDSTGNVSSPRSGSVSVLFWSSERGNMAWASADANCTAMGGGWRLPSMDELQAIWNVTHSAPPGWHTESPDYQTYALYWSNYAIPDPGGTPLLAYALSVRWGAFASNGIYDTNVYTRCVR